MQGNPNRRTQDASGLWEDWRRARPFTVGEGFYNIGDTHDLAFAAASFGSVRKIPNDFDGWERLARKVEHNYVRGWVARDGSRMFLWDDLGNLLGSRTSHFERFVTAVGKLHGKGYATGRTELWDRGGERLVGKLGELGLIL
jgi:hypothetical protein